MRVGQSLTLLVLQPAVAGPMLVSLRNRGVMSSLAGPDFGHLHEGWLL